MAKIEYSPSALDDLIAIRDYVASNWGEDVAKRILKKIVADIGRLEEYQALGIDLGELIEVPTDYRYLLTEKNYVFYRLEFDKVRILRVLNQRQEYMHQLFGESMETD